MSSQHTLTDWDYDHLPREVFMRRADLISALCQQSHAYWHLFLRAARPRDNKRVRHAYRKLCRMRRAAELPDPPYYGYCPYGAVEAQRACEAQGVSDE